MRVTTHERTSFANLDRLVSQNVDPRLNDDHPADSHRLHVRHGDCGSGGDGAVRQSSGCLAHSTAEVMAEYLIQTVIQLSV